MTVTDSWPPWLTDDRLAQLEAATPDRTGDCPCCGKPVVLPDWTDCDCPDAAAGLAVLLAARRESCRDA